MEMFGFYKNCSIKVLCLVILLNMFVSTNSLGDRYTSQLSTYKEIVPRKVNEDGVFLSHFIPHFFETGRKKRDVLSEQLHYIIPIDGVDHHVSLWPNSDFFAPGMVVETHYQRNNRSHISVRQARSTQCHYNGFIKGIDKSRATLATCYGLAGHILLPGEEYFIEPSLNGNQYSEYHVHYVYKRSDLKNTSNVTNCGTKGKFSEAYRERMEYEKKYGYKIEKSITSLNRVMNSMKYQPRFNRDCQDSTSEPEDNDDICPPSENKVFVKAARFLEVLVVVDYRLERTFNHDLETFIFTIFNMVVSNFHDKSMGTPLHIKMVRIIYLTYTLPRLDMSRYSPSVLLANFCDWQLEVNPYLESHPNHHDFAVFISRFAPCQEKVLGLTHMASVCRLDKACTVVSEEGLLLANIITHQIGHSLGADHDDSETGGCAGEEPDGTRYHMNPVMSLSSSEWSICSQHCLSQFINTRISWCLADPPDEHDFKIPDILPGQVYDAIHQCSINFRMRTLACRTGDFCKELFCQITPTKCASTGDPPALGTPCAKDMWCFNGMCVHRGQRPGAINGEWGPWTQWSSCTRSCGGGVQSRYRSCDKPSPYHGGSYCVGEWMAYRMCNTRRCSGYAPSFRQMQCKMTDKRAYRGRFYMWDHFRSFFEEMKCTLVCINEKKQVSIRSPIVIDGTPCASGTNNICIQGNCRRVGCDYVIDSESKEDGCGKCHGNGTECKMVEGAFTDPNVYGIIPLLKLPIGTTMTYLRELDQSNCYFIIGSSINSTFFLNSPTSGEQLPGQFECGGTSGVYENHMNIERIFIKGAIQIPITVSLKCSDQQNAGIHYQYALPEVDIAHAPIYKWYFLYWEECSVLCGGGTQRARAVCIETRSGEVDDKYCIDKPKPEDVIRTCNHHHCTAKWWVGPWSNCDCKDGEGIMTRLVLCMKVPSEDGTYSKVTKEKECCHEPKPRIQRPCNEAVEAIILHRKKREKPMNEEGSYKIQFFEHNPLQHERGNHWKPDLDYGSYFNPRYQKTSFNVDDNIMNSSFPKRHAKKKKVRRKNRRKMQNKTYPSRIIETPLLEESGIFPTKKKILRNESIEPELINEIINEELIECKERKKDDNLSTEGITISEETIATTIINSTDIITGTTQQSSFQNNAFTNLPLNESLTLPLGDLFLENVFVEHLSTTCEPQNNVIEPADLGPRYDTGNNSAYKLLVIPIIPNSAPFPLTDYEIEIFGDSGFWPIASRAEKLLISGDKMFKIINEASRRGTKPPVIELENV